MKNLILAIVIMVAGFVGTSGKAGASLRFLMIGLIGAIMLFVSASSAAASDYGPAIGLGAFVGTLGVFWLLRRKRG